jgi:hypothetical protein
MGCILPVNGRRRQSLAIDGDFVLFALLVCLPARLLPRKTAYRKL